MKSKRKNIITLVPDDYKRKLQLKYARILLLSQTASILIVISFLTIIFTIMINQKVPLLEDAPSEKVYALIMIFYVIATVASVALTWLISIRLSHKILGPLFRIENLLNQAIETGEIPTFTIRKDDELQNIVTLLNTLFENIKNKKCPEINGK
jgi:hypothetical protein